MNQSKNYIKTPVVEKFNSTFSKFNKTDESLRYESHEVKVSFEDSTPIQNNNDSPSSKHTDDLKKSVHDTQIKQNTLSDSLQNFDEETKIHNNSIKSSTGNYKINEPDAKIQYGNDTAISRQLVKEYTSSIIVEVPLAEENKSGEKILEKTEDVVQKEAITGTKSFSSIMMKNIRGTRKDVLICSHDTKLNNRSCNTSTSIYSLPKSSKFENLLEGIESLTKKMRKDVQDTSDKLKYFKLKSARTNQQDVSINDKSSEN